MYRINKSCYTIFLFVWYAINNNIKLLIVTGSNDVLKENIKLAEKNKVNIIRTHLDTFTASKLIGLSNKVKNILHQDSIKFKESDFYDDFVEETKKIMELLNRDGIKVEEISDYHIYPIADNDTPMLLSFGGSLGAMRVNSAVSELIKYKTGKDPVPGKTYR
mgnify:CR=1 FL=1